MPLVGLSLLYHALASKPFESVLNEMRRDFKKYEKPDFWEVVDDEDYYPLSRERVKKLLELKDLGVRYTVHCPIKGINIASLNDEVRKKSISRLKLSIDYAAELDALVFILHPGLKPADEYLKKAKEYCFDNLTLLYDYCKSYGIRIGIENTIDNMLREPDDFYELYDETSIRFSIVFDGGHANLNNNVKEFILKLGRYFLVIHVHNNNGNYDEHLAVDNGNIDWKFVIKEMNKINFNGYYVVEVSEKPFESIKWLKSSLFKLMLY
jgi:sugar phosphate isomerase/epimerase